MSDQEPTAPNEQPGAADDQPTAPNQRTFSLNSREFYEAMCEPSHRPWIPNGALPRDPPARDLPVITDPNARASRR